MSAAVRCGGGGCAASGSASDYNNTNVLPSNKVITITSMISRSKLASPLLANDCPGYVNIHVKHNDFDVVT